MAEPFIGSEAVANGDVGKSASCELAIPELFPDVYVRAGTPN